MAIKNQINRAPLGWLGLLRSKVGGQTPTTWEDKLRPVVDMGGYYAASNISTAKFTTTGSSGSAMVNLGGVVIPQGINWLIHTVSLSVYTTDQTTADAGSAGVLVRNLPELVSTVGVTQNPFLCYASWAKLATSEFGVGDVFTPGSTLILPAGASITVTQVTATAGIVRDYSMHVLFSPLQA